MPIAAADKSWLGLRDLVQILGGGLSALWVLRFVVSVPFDPQSSPRPSLGWDRSLARRSEMEPNSSGRQAIAAARVERKAEWVWTFREAWHHDLALQVPRRLGLSPGAIANPGEDVVRDAERTAKLSSARPVNTLPLTKSLGGHRLLLCVVAGSGSVGEGRYRLCEGAAKNADVLIPFDSGQQPHRALVCGYTSRGST